MAKIPAYGKGYSHDVNPITVTVHALKENKAQCGFVWPEIPKKRKPRRKTPPKDSE